MRPRPTPWAVGRYRIVWRGGAYEVWRGRRAAIVRAGGPAAPKPARFPTLAAALAAARRLAESDRLSD